MLYNDTLYVDDTKLAGFVSQHLSSLLSGIKVVVLSQWLNADHGVLVTHELQFWSCEADAVICVTRDWAGYTDIKSPVTLAVAHLCLIASDYNVSVPMMKKNWEVEIMERRGPGSDSDINQ